MHALDRALTLAISVPMRVCRNGSAAALVADGEFAMFNDSRPNRTLTISTTR
jgi:hypothetical protein